MKYIITGLLCLVALMAYNIKTLSSENRLLRTNQNTILTQYDRALAECQKYKISDSINAASVQALTLSLDDYKKYYADSYKRLKQLQHSKAEMQSIISQQTETINKLSVPTENRIDTTSQDTLKCFTYDSKWTSIAGCINLRTDTVNIQITNRESIKVLQTITYKRFLGFLWKTNKVKSQQLDIYSENPATQIINAEYINITN